MALISLEKISTGGYRVLDTFSESELGKINESPDGFYRFLFTLTDSDDGLVPPPPLGYELLLSIGDTLQEINSPSMHPKYRPWDVVDLEEQDLTYLLPTNFDKLWGNANGHECIRHLSCSGWKALAKERGNILSVHADGITCCGEVNIEDVRGAEAGRALKDNFLDKAWDAIPEQEREDIEKMIDSGEVEMPSILLDSAGEYHLLDGEINNLVTGLLFRYGALKAWLIDASDLEEPPPVVEAKIVDGGPAQKRKRDA